MAIGDWIADWRVPIAIADCDCRLVIGALQSAIVNPIGTRQPKRQSLTKTSKANQNVNRRFVNRHSSIVDS
jgi:hypothetical protein